MFSSSLIILALSSSALANVFVTSPVSSTTFVGGQQSTVSWQDNGQQPSLQSFGPSIVSIYAGNSQQQTLLQTIAPSVDTSTTQSIVFTVDPSIGPDADQYFVRFESISLKDTTSPQYPALAFSAKFSMSGMSGQFNATVQAQIDGQSTAPIGGTAAPASSTPAAGAGATSAAAAPTSSKASSVVSAAAGAAKTSSASGASSTNGATTRIAGAGLAAFAGVAAAVISVAFC